MQQAQPIYIANGELVERLPADTEFGSGVLETMRHTGSGIPLWPYHLARLTRCSDVSPQTVSSIQAAIASLSKAGLLPTTTRRVRLRYRRSDRGPVWDLSAVPFDPGNQWQKGVDLDLCDTVFSGGHDGSVGCKHLDRALYNQAAAELTGLAPGPNGPVEGLLRDSGGRVIETLRCNLLLWLEGNWLTPSLARYGVRGVMRDWLMHQQPIVEAAVTLDMVLRAEEVALCNSLRGVIPVVSLVGLREWSRGKQTASLQERVTTALW